MNKRIDLDCPYIGIPKQYSRRLQIRDEEIKRLLKITDQQAIEIIKLKELIKNKPRKSLI